jgi:3-oxoacyl-[acyl-carrier-protein] synthase-3
MPDSQRTAYIAGIGMAVPPKVVTNEDFTRIVDTSDEWITQMTGIKERRYTDENTATSDLAVEASRVALERAGTDPLDVDAIVVATATPDMLFPSTACLVQHAIGATNAFAYDISAACSGFIFGLVQAQNFIRSGNVDTVLLIGAECLTKITDMSDRNTCVLFGDGAGAAVVKCCEPPRGLLDYVLKCDGSLSDYIKQPAGGSRNPSSTETVGAGDHVIRMKGRQVYVNASKNMSDAVMQVLEQQGLTGDDVDLLFPHQANIRIIQSVAERAGMPMEKVYVNIQKYGNTSAASIPIALAEAVEEGALKEGMLVALVAFGSGFTWGSALLRW